MKPGVSSFGLVLMLVAAPAAEKQEAREDDDPRLELLTIKRIYVERLGGGETANHIRDMIIGSLQRSGRFILTENEERADAFLRGSAEDLVFTDTFQSSEGINARASAGTGRAAAGSSSAARGSRYASLSVGDHESTRIAERKHEAAAAVRIVNRDGDVIWSATKESLGAKFRGASADVADKITKQLLEDIRKLEAARTAKSP
jgi:hypothetical protein